ncbi:MAG: hypothetical protein KUG56_02135, partial [Kordiimonadaceae bacterium]|nr:hypothetical protein [Kordiimonadaceae bacterium]
KRQRLWRAGVSHTLSDTITVIKCNASKFSKAARSDSLAKLYHLPDSEQEIWMEMIETHGIEKLVSVLKRDVATFRAEVKRVKRFSGSAYFEPFNKSVNVETARSFFETGYDSFNGFCEDQNLQRGFILKVLLKRRTGEILPDHHDWSAVIQHAQQSFPRRV